jgi:phage terminase small subunit
MAITSYLVDLNATQAAIRAGYSARTAAQQGSRLLSNVKVQSEIAEAFKARIQRIEFDSDRLLNKLVEEEEHANIKSLYNTDGSIKNVLDWPDLFCSGIVAQIDTELIYEGQGKDRTLVGEVQKVKFNWDRMKRRELLGRHTKVQAFKDKVEVDASDPLKQLFQQIAGNGIRPREGV